jgi:hypothetical protein
VKPPLLLFLLIVPGYLPCAYGDQLALERSWGLIKSNDADAVWVRYQFPARALFKQESFYEFSLGSWNGSHRNSTIGVARGLRGPLGEHTYWSGNLGLAHVAHVNDHTGTHTQVVSRLALGRLLDSYDVSFGLVHYSNGHLHGANVGGNFLGLSIGRNF